MAWVERVGVRLNVDNRGIVNNNSRKIGSGRLTSRCLT